MQILLGVTILALWVVACILLMRGQAMVPVLIGLAVAWALLAGAGDKVLKDVIEGGILSFANTTMVIIMGAWLAETLMQTGIAETLIRNAAELAGDRPMAITVAMVLVITFLFTSMYGVGAAVMVGVIALPIMLTMGIPANVVAPVFTFSIIAGIQLSLVEWGIFQPLFKIEQGFNTFFTLYVVQLCIWAAMAVVLAFVKIHLLGAVRTHAVNTTGYGSGTIDDAEGGSAPARRAPWYALISPIVPVVAVMAFKWPLVPAFLAGIVFALLTTIHYRPFRITVDLFQKALYDGFRSMAPVCAVWMIIGAIIKASSLPEVQAPLKALLGGVLPSTPWAIAIFLGILAPLAVYRGPMCLAGVGSALVPLFLGMKTVSPGFLWGAWKGINYVHGTTDPINSWTLWTLGYLKITGASHIKTALPFSWAAAALTAITAVLMLYR
ncbi:MAG: hypothetical protein ACHQ7N_00620 [Candidatus Methylomirabilales bacterium]